MIDRDKVAFMTREAMMQKKNRREIFPAANYYLYDYVTFQVIKGLLGSTVIFLMGTACWLAYTMETWISTVSLEEVLDMARSVGKVYLISMAAMAVLLAIVYTIRYFQSVKCIRREVSHLKRLMHYYDMEDRKWGE